MRVGYILAKCMGDMFPEILVLSFDAVHCSEEAQGQTKRMVELIAEHVPYFTMLRALGRKEKRGKARRREGGKKGWISTYPSRAVPSEASYLESLRSTLFFLLKDRSIIVYILSSPADMVFAKMLISTRECFSPQGHVPVLSQT